MKYIIEITSDSDTGDQTVTVTKGGDTTPSLFVGPFKSSVVFASEAGLASDGRNAERLAAALAQTLVALI